MQLEFNFPQDSTQEIPYGYCQCGCGQKTAITPHSHEATGMVKGQPRRFIRGHKITDDVSRFWAKVDKRGPDECWVWVGKTQRNGYGVFSIRSKYVRAHRYSYELHNGPFPSELDICHKCDNRPCVNPNHLFAGTAKDNGADMARKGRGRHTPTIWGEMCPQTPLTEAQVLEIRERNAAGESQRAIARRFNIAQGSVSKIVLRKTWRHI